MATPVAGDMSNGGDAAGAVVGHLLEAVLAGGDLDRLADLVAPDVVVRDVAFGDAYESREAYREHQEVLEAAFPDHETTFEVIAAGDDAVTVEWTLHGTHEGPFLGVEPTGNDVSFSGLDVYRVSDGRVVEVTGCFDLFGLAEQLGVVDAPWR